MHYKIEEIVDYLDNNDLWPAVIFVFSIKRITEYAKMLSLKNLIPKSQKNEINKFTKVKLILCQLKTEKYPKLKN